MVMEAEAKRRQRREASTRDPQCCRWGAFCDVTMILFLLEPSERGRGVYRLKTGNHKNDEVGMRNLNQPTHGDGCANGCLWVCPDRQTVTGGVGARRAGVRMVVVFALSLLLAWPCVVDAGADGAGTTMAGSSAGKTMGDLALEQAITETAAALSGLKMDEQQLGRAREQIRGLSYTNMRVLRVFAALPGMTADSIMDVLQRLEKMKIAYGNLVILEHFATLPGVDSDLAWLLLKKLGNLSYVAGRVASVVGQTKNLQPQMMLGLLDRLAPLRESALWALKAYLEIPGQTAETVDRGMAHLARMNEKQCWATESSCLIAGMTPEAALRNMEYIQRLSNTDVSNARSFFRLPDMTPETSLVWLSTFFSVLRDVQEERFFAMNAREKSMLLDAYAGPDAADYLIWKINNLHDITDENGREIGIRVLSSAPSSFLRGLFQRLDPRIQARFKGEFEAGLAASRGAAISALRRATSAARMQAAKDCTTANAYILLSLGSDLYDSSFREFLVPVMKDRVDARFAGNLLAFLHGVDPQSIHVSDFIISLAQKGRLTVFFPTSVAEQQKVIDLVTHSAFRDEKSLILFSATFMTLLEAIQPETRTYLIGRMLTAIHEQDTVFSTQLRVILQYYIQEHAQLVGEVDKIRIRLMMSQYGVIDLDQYVKNSFAEWKMDGKLSSLSIFQGDDDGVDSYRSNCQTLMNHGYRPRISTSFFLMSRGNLQDEAATQRLRGLLAAPSQNLGAIQQMQERYPLVVDWVKNVQGIEISHSVVVYHDERRQQELLRQFLKGGHEMFAQRGHSYWRKEQLLDPLYKLIKSGEVTEADLMAKQRFLSLGSCGGIRVYTELALIFNNRVDILATVGTGKAIINDPYNHFLFELVASRSGGLSWKEVGRQAAAIFKRGMGEEYLQPGSLPAILHKIMDQKQMKKRGGHQAELRHDGERDRGPGPDRGGLEVRESFEGLTPNY